MASSNISMLHKTGNNAQSDECYTPPAAVSPLIKYLNPNLTHHEPTSGISQSIALTLEGAGIKCTLQRGDFFKSDIVEDVIVTNPPYSKKDKFIRHCYDLRKPFALLLPVSSIQGQRRGRMFDEYGIDLLVLNQRVDFTGKGAPHFGVAWFTWGILPERLIFEDM
jgi:hypothetical protein